ncbi:MAG: hypothetical protein IJX99_08810 [Clostridia bacterium]|nr:hypothetical protein [Clostridia bacterium]
MPSCLGIYTDRNMIKYAKVTSTTDKVAGQSFSLDAYGVKFYDNIQATVDEIVDEVGADQSVVALSLSNEDYYMAEVFSNLKRKDMLELIQSEYAEKKGETSFPASVLEMRYKLALNSGSMDKHLALCVAASKGELANLRKNFEQYKISSIVPLSVSLKNLFPNQAIDEEAIVINIEDKTTVTVFHRSEIQYVTSIQLGAQEIITKLSEKYNSASKAYEACKKVSAYISDAYDMDDESRDILDVVIPVLYDIRQQVDAIVTPYLRDARKIYITGTGAIINNIDLYFSEVFLDTECEVLKPFFVYKEDPNIKDIVEVNSAIALALDGVGMAEIDLDFNAMAKKAAGVVTLKEKVKKLGLDEKFTEYKTKTTDFMKKLNAPVKTKKRKKRNVAFDEGLLSGTGSQGADSEVEEEQGTYGRVDSGLVKLAVFAITFLTTYSIASSVINKQIQAKTQEINAEIGKANAVIQLANDDSQYLKSVADDYVEITNKLSAIIVKIEEDRTSSRIDFDIPNFLSKLMFIMPANVRVTSIDVDEIGNVKIQAESGQYAQLGFFVSRLKVEEILQNVDMEVVSDSENIKIIVSGVMP